MSDIKSIEINYQSNYNGCYLYNPEIDDSLDDEKAMRCINHIIDHAVDDCNDNGMYMGSISTLREYALKVVRNEYGPDVELTFVVDSIST